MKKPFTFMSFSKQTSTTNLINNIRNGHQLSINKITYPKVAKNRVARWTKICLARILVTVLILILILTTRMVNSTHTLTIQMITHLNKFLKQTKKRKKAIMKSRLTKNQIRANLNNVQKKSKLVSNLGACLSDFAKQDESRYTNKVCKSKQSSYSKSGFLPKM